MRTDSNDSNFVATAECIIMDPVPAMTIAEDLSMRYDKTYKNWKREEDMSIEG